MRDKKTLVEVKNVDKIYKTGDEVVYALRNISLECYQGEYRTGAEGAADE